MSVWTGWQNDLLAAAKFPTSTANRAFLTAWHQHAESNCHNNPVDISKQFGGWTACHHLDPGRTANNYASHSDAATAFADQAFGSEFLLLNAGFENSTLDTLTVSADVIAEIKLWGSATFAAWLEKNASGGAGSGAIPTTLHKGWDDLRRSGNVKLHKSLSQSQRASAAALRQLARARRVKL